MTTTGTRTGRRPGAGTTKPAILQAARELFAELGYERTTLRAVAARAEVDVAMIGYHFGGKSQLFVAAQELPANPSEILAAAAPGPIDGLGERLAAAAVSVWSEPTAQRVLVAMIRSNVGGDSPLDGLGSFIQEAVVGSLAGALRGSDELELDETQIAERAYLCATQLAGVLMTRYVLQLPYAVSLTDEQLVQMIGRALQHHLTGASCR